MITLGFDTSNYTTSVAAFDGTAGVNFSRLLDVEAGQLGLRQSDALFSHVKRLPELSKQLFDRVEAGEIRAIAVSSRPRAVEGSYMPCFLAGVSQASVLASALRVPLFEISHQQGHLAAAVFSSGRTELADRPFLAWHLSGGTTELLYVRPEGRNFAAQIIGGTSDISAGQIIDRTGKALSLPFPAGKALDRLSEEAEGKEFFAVKTAELRFSFSGLENKMREYYAKTQSPAETAAYVLRSVCSAVLRTTREAVRLYPGLPVLFSGGVSSNRMLRGFCAELDAVFAEPQYSTDNALGAAILAWRLGGF